MQRVTGVPGFGMPLTPRLVRPSPYAVYAVVLGAAVFASMSWPWFAGLASVLAHRSSGHGLGFAFFLAWALAVVGCLTLALRAAGPVGLTRPALTWCLGLPTLSSLLLRRSFRSRMLLATVAGTTAGIAAALVVSPVSTWPVPVLTIGGAGVVGAAMAGVTAAEQVETSAPRRSVRFPTARTLGTVATVAGVLTWYLASFEVISVRAGAALGSTAVFAVLIVVLGAWYTRRVHAALGSGEIALGELHRAGDVADRVAASAVMLTTVLLEPAPRRRRAIRFATTARLTRGRAGWLALLDLRRVLARWPALLVVVGVVPLAGSVTHVAGRAWGCLVLTVIAYGVAVRLCRWLFAWNASPSLRFLVPFGAASTRAALLVTPVLGVLAVTTAAVGLAGLSPWWIGTALVSALVGVRRRIAMTRIGADFGLLMLTPMGALPINLLRRLVSGWDAAVLAGLLAFVLPDAAALRATIVLGLLYGVLAAASGVGRRALVVGLRQLGASTSAARLRHHAHSSSNTKNV